MPNFTVDYFRGDNGKTYCMALITVNQDFGSWAQNICRKKVLLENRMIRITEL